MQDREFDEIVENLFNSIEDEVDELDADVDVDSTAGMLTLEFPDGSSVVLSRQVANHEIWVAARSGGFHLAYGAHHWVCGTTDEALGELLNRIFTEQLNQPVTIFESI
jgi:CyaY protein